MTIERRQAGSRVDHQQRDIGLVERALGLCPHATAERLRRCLLEPRRIDQAEIEIGDAALGLAAVAGDPRRIVDQRQRPPGQPIEQRRFADIRPADDRHRETHGRCRSALRISDRRRDLRRRSASKGYCPR